jgi:hypothetical protein
MNTLRRIGVASHSLAAGGRGRTLGVLAQLLCAVVLLLAATLVRAEDASCSKEERDGLLACNSVANVIPQLGPTCYGVPEEQQPLSQEIHALIDKDPTSERLAAALRTLATRVKTGEVYGSQATRDAFAKRAQEAADDVARNVPAGEGKTSPSVWQVDHGIVSAVPGLNVMEILNNGCPPMDGPTTKSCEADPSVAKAQLGAISSNKTCQAAITSAKAWLRVVTLADATLSRYSGPALNELLVRSTNRLAMWHAYRDEALPQFQWEWFVNSWRLNKADKGPNGRPRDANNQPIGPMKAPTDQIILLHPGVGLEYRNKPGQQPTAGTSSGSKTEPILYLELVGRYRWSWDESTGKMIGGSGVSLVVSYADRNNDKRVGYGLLFHSRLTKAYTLGITRSGHATNVIFNVDLAEFFKDKLSYWKGVESAATQ